MKTDSKSVLLFAAISTILFSSAVFAGTPGIPHQFFGSVMINGAPAPDGTAVSAKIGVVVVGSTTTAGGTYGHSPDIFYVEDPNHNREGSLIQFFVNNVKTGSTAYFANGKSTLLDLSATIASQNNDQVTSSSSGGGGGSSPVTNTPVNNSVASDNGTGSNTVTAPSGPCTEQWTCDAWSLCTDGIQRRSCKDANKCGTIEDLPMTSQPCANESGVVSPNPGTSFSGGFSGITGQLFSFASSGAGYAAGMIVLAGLAIYYITSRAKKSANNMRPMKRQL